MKGHARLATCTFVAALVAVGCGGTSSRSLSPPARTQLEALERRVRQAASAFDPAGAQQALTELQHVVASDQRKGEIGATKAAQILTAAADVTNLLVLDVKPTTASTSTTAATTTTIVDPTTDNRGGDAPPPRGKDHKPKGDAGD